MKHFSLLVKGLALAALMTSGLAAQNVITCASDNGRRNLCPADTSQGVQLVRQRSDSPCEQGRSWGWNTRGIWVSRGCRADFVLGNNRPGPGYRPGYGPGPGAGPDYGYGGGGNRTVINCSSDDGKRHWCGNPTNRDVRLVKQYSDSPCRRGYSWDTQPGSVWVDRGCRADFEIRTR